MKTKFVLCVLLFVSISITLSAQVRYVRNIPIIMPDPEFYRYKYTTKQIFECPDGGIMVLGDCIAQYNEDPPRFAADCGVIKLDADGNCQWQWWSTDFYATYDPSIIGIDQEADGRVNFLINHYPHDKIGWIDPQQNFSLQDLQLPGCEINRALRLSDNSIFAIGWDHPGADLGKHIFFMHLNAMGDTLSTRSYPSDSLWVYFDPSAPAAYDMELDADGLPVSSCIFSDRFASVVKTDRDGNIIWRRDTNYRTAVQPIPLTKIPLTNEIIFGCQAWNNWNYNQFCLYKVTTDGIDSLFTIQMTDSTCAGSYYSMVGHNQGICLSGFYAPYPANPEDHLIHISNYNLSGQPMWIWTSISPSNWDQSTDCTIELANGCLLYGFGNSHFGQYGLTIVKLHPDGTPNEEDTLPIPQNNLLAYPNPMKSIVKLELSLSENSRSQNIPIRIYNIKGQVVKTIQLEKISSRLFSKTWDGRDAFGYVCASGTYIVKSETGIYKSTKKIIIIK